MWVISWLSRPLMPIEMSPSAVTAKAILTVAPDRMNGSLPVAAPATAARIVSIASVSTSSSDARRGNRPAFPAHRYRCEAGRSAI